MNILLFTDADVFAGTERHILDLAVALTAMGQTVAVACPVPAPLADRARAAGIKLLAVAKKRMPDFAAIKILAAELRSGRIDLIHAHNGRTHLLAIAAIKRAGRGRVVATQHFLSPNRTGRRGPKAWVANQLHHWAIKNTAAFIAISHAVKEQMLARHDAPAEKITVVHNGTTEPEKTSPEEMTALRSELGANQRPMIFCAARLQKEKDIPTLINAFATLRSTLNSSDPQITQISQINDVSRQDSPAAPNPSNSSPDAKCQMPDAQCSPPATAPPKKLISDQCSVVSESSEPVLFIAGDGDQRTECERLIETLYSTNNDGIATEITEHTETDKKLEICNAGGPPVTEHLALSISHLENVARPPSAGNNKQNESAAFPSHAKCEMPDAHCSTSAALPNSSNSSQLDAGSIRLLGFRSDVPALMSACDVFVSPCPVEGFGLVILEAMAMGKPVIAAAAGGPLEIITDGETGLLFEPGNIQSLAAAIKQLLDNKDLRTRMGLAGRKRYEEKFTATEMAKNMLAVYTAAQRSSEPQR